MKESPTPSKSYMAFNEKMGLPGTHSTHDPDDCSNQSITYSADPIRSDVPPKLIFVDSISKLKELIGATGVDKDADVEYPAPFMGNHAATLGAAKSKTDFHQKVSEEDKDNIKIAASAYLRGDHEKVKDYEGIINATMFPKPVALFASSKDLVISQQITVHTSEETPVVWNYESITFKPGGSIEVNGTGTFKIQCSTMNKIT